ncbi:MAG: hypothetical protein P8M68_01965 [Aquiluna sp.]|nr:hypothetical protein [Aquiluna sp.]
MSDQFAVLGSPISHSKSPVIHDVCFRMLARDAVYGAFQVSELGVFLADNPQFKGLSITMPLKEQAFLISESHDAMAKLTQNCNTLVRTPSGWSGYNTDVFGLRQAANGRRFDRVSVLGSGSSARSALAAFQDKETLVWGRNSERVLGLASQFQAISVSLEEALNADLVVSTLPAGVLTELIQNSSNFPGILFDISYAKSEGSDPRFAGGAISGLDMLVWQAIMQQRIFAGREPTDAFPNEAKMLEVITTALNMAK